MNTFSTVKHKTNRKDDLRKRDKPLISRADYKLTLLSPGTKQKRPEPSQLHGTLVTLCPQLDTKMGEMVIAFTGIGIASNLVLFAPGIELSPKRQALRTSGTRPFLVAL